MLGDCSSPVKGDEHGEEQGEEEEKTDDEEVLPSHEDDDPFCPGGSEEGKEEAGAKEGGEEEARESDPDVNPFEKHPSPAVDDHVGEEGVREEKDGGALKALGCFGLGFVRVRII